MKKYHIIPSLLILPAILLAACGTTSPETPPDTLPVENNTPVTQFIVITATQPPMTNTPDPCASENIEAEAQKIHAYMREFDDASTLAASRPREELAASIADLQRIRRNAEDQPTPSCFVTLKTHQISHMNSVINTLIAFMSGADQAAVDEGIALARNQHDQYALELARVLGLTVEPVSIVTPAQTPTP